MSDRKKPRRDTVRGFADAPTSEEQLKAPAVPGLDGVEVELVYERGRPGMQTDRWRAFEVWTQNRIYLCDWGMRCVEVLDRKSGEIVEGHSLLGAYLAGGQRQDDDHMEMTYPCPRPGTEAVFEYRGSRKGYVNTSTVTRVVLRLRVLTVPRERATPTWEELTAQRLRLPTWDD